MYARAYVYLYTGASGQFIVKILYIHPFLLPERARTHKGDSYHFHTGLELCDFIMLHYLKII